MFNPNPNPHSSTTSSTFLPSANPNPTPARSPLSTFSHPMASHHHPQSQGLGFDHRSPTQGPGTGQGFSSATTSNYPSSAAGGMRGGFGSGGQGSRFGTMSIGQGGSGEDFPSSGGGGGGGGGGAGTNNNNQNQGQSRGPWGGNDSFPTGNTGSHATGGGMGQRFGSAAGGGGSVGEGRQSSAGGGGFGSAIGGGIGMGMGLNQHQHQHQNQGREFGPGGFGEGNGNGLGLGGTGGAGAGPLSGGYGFGQGHSLGVGAGPAFNQQSGPPQNTQSLNPNQVASSHSHFHHSFPRSSFEHPMSARETARERLQMGLDPPSAISSNNMQGQVLPGGGVPLSAAMLQMDERALGLGGGKEGLGLGDRERFFEEQQRGEHGQGQGQEGGGGGGGGMRGWGGQRGRGRGRMSYEGPPPNLGPGPGPGPGGMRGQPGQGYMGVGGGGSHSHHQQQNQPFQPQHHQQQQGFQPPGGFGMQSHHQQNQNQQQQPGGPLPGPGGNGSNGPPNGNHLPPFHNQNQPPSAHPRPPSLYEPEPPNTRSSGSRSGSQPGSSHPSRRPSQVYERNSGSQSHSRNRSVSRDRDGRRNGSNQGGGGGRNRPTGGPGGEDISNATARLVLKSPSEKGDSQLQPQSSQPQRRDGRGYDGRSRDEESRDRYGGQDEDKSGRYRDEGRYPSSQPQSRSQSASQNPPFGGQPGRSRAGAGAGAVQRVREEADELDELTPQGSKRGSRSRNRSRNRSASRSRTRQNAKRANSKIRNADDERGPAPYIPNVGRGGSGRGGKRMDRVERNDRPDRDRGDRLERLEREDRMDRGDRRDDRDEEISTIFMVGFPEDISEREFTNMFTFANGFEAASLRFPNAPSVLSPRDAMSPNSSLPSSMQQQFGGNVNSGDGEKDQDPSGQDDTAELMGRDNQVVESRGSGDTEAGLAKPHAAGVSALQMQQNSTNSSSTTSLVGIANQRGPPRRQVIGFARFRTRTDALIARDILQGRKVDIFSGATLKVEMAKKNLHSRKGVGAGAVTLNGIPESEIMDVLMRSGKLPGLLAGMGMGGFVLTRERSGSQTRSRQPESLRGGGPGSSHTNSAGPLSGRSTPSLRAMSMTDSFATLGQMGNCQIPPHHSSSNNSNTQGQPGGQQFGSDRALSPAAGSRLRSSFSSQPGNQDFRAPALSPRFSQAENADQTPMNNRAYKHRRADSQRSVFSNDWNNPTTLTQVPEHPFSTSYDDKQPDFRGQGQPQARSSDSNSRPFPGDRRDSYNADHAGGFREDIRSPPSGFTSPVMSNAPRDSKALLALAEAEDDADDWNIGVGGMDALGSFDGDSRNGSPVPENLSRMRTNTNSSLGDSSALSGMTSPSRGHEQPFVPRAMQSVNSRRSFGAGSAPRSLSDLGSNSLHMGDQNPPINTLYVGNLPSHLNVSHSPSYLEECLRNLFVRAPGFKRMSFRQKVNGPMCFVEFETVELATQGIKDWYGNTLGGLIKGGLRLSYSKNNLGQRAAGISRINTGTSVMTMSDLASPNSYGGPTSPLSPTSSNGNPFIHNFVPGRPSSNDSGQHSSYKSDTPLSPLAAPFNSALPSVMNPASPRSGTFPLVDDHRQTKDGTMAPISPRLGYAAPWAMTSINHNNTYGNLLRGGEQGVAKPSSQ